VRCGSDRVRRGSDRVWRGKILALTKY
jgi:hypothetical protein